MIHIENLVKYYALGKSIIKALRGVNLTVNKGDIITIAGPSGSGKTTLLNLIGCIDKPSSGHVYINDQDIHLFSQVRQ